MATIFYEVEALFADESIALRWLDWLRDEHIADVMRGGATGGRAIRLDPPADAAPLAGEVRYCVQYEFPSRAAFDRYLAEFAPRLREEGLKRFAPPQVRYARRSGDVVLEQ